MNENLQNHPEKSEQEIDLVELVRKLWKKKWFIFRACCIGGVIGIVVAFSIPKEYTTEVKLAPEASSGSKGNMGALAAIAGINLQQNTSDITPELYPEIVNSTPFLLGLLDLQVADNRQGINTSLFCYLSDFQKEIWWNHVFKFPFTVLKWLRPKAKEGTVYSNQKIISLSKDQDKVIQILNKTITVSVNKITGVISLKATMQSADISAHLVDTLSSYMQNYIISYRTEKARQDLNFTQMLFDESQQKYFEAQQKYADYSDRHQNIVSAVFGTTIERLQNEMNLAFNVYNQMAQQLQMAKIKVQDTTPMCKTIQPAVMPLSPSAPRKMMILIGFGFLAFVGACGWVLFGSDFLLRFKDE